MKISSLQFNGRISLVLMILAAFLGSFSGLGVKEINWNPMAIAGVRSGIACLFMILALGKPRFTFSKAQLAGALSYAICLILTVVSLKYTTAANSALLTNTAPIYVAIFGSWVLHEKTQTKDWVTLIVVMGGLALFFLDQLTIGGMEGNIYAALGGFAQAWVGIFMRMQKDESPLETFVLGSALVFIVSLPWLHPMPDMKSLYILGGLGLIQIGFADILYAVSIRNVSALQSKLIYNLKPILSPLWVFLVIGEKPGKWALLGGFIVLSAITAHGTLSLYQKKYQRNH